MVTTSFFGVLIRVTKGVFLDYIPGSIIQLNPVAQFKRTHISNDQPRNHITDYRADPKEMNQTDKNR